MAKEYIDKEAFISRYRELYCKDCERRKGMKNGKMRFVYEIGDAPCRACNIDDMLDYVEDWPAADVRENIKARWELYGGDDDLDCYYFCSNCHTGYNEGWFYFHGEYHPFAHCPCCGAKMEVQDG